MSIPTLYQIGKVNSRGNFTLLDIYLLGKSGQHLPMDSKQIRRANAKALSLEVGGNAAFANVTGIPESRVSHLIGKNPTKNIGDQTAREIETAFKKPLGWLDVLHAPEAALEPHGLEARAWTPPTQEEIGELNWLFMMMLPEFRETLLVAARANAQESEAQRQQDAV